MLNNIPEGGLSKTHKVRVVNFPGVTSEKITDRLDDLIKRKPDDLLSTSELLILQTMLIF